MPGTTTTSSNQYECPWRYEQSKSDRNDVRGAISYNKVFNIVPLVKIQICLSILMGYSENHRLELN